MSPKAVTLPGLSLTSAPDRIVPLASAVLAPPDSTKLRTALGHIGMVVSENAQEPAWDAIVNWLERKL